MPIPNSGDAYVPREKLTAYLLSETHPVGKAKAKFFRAHGFTEEGVDLLEEGLLTIVRENEPQEVIASPPHGTKYVVTGSLLTPRGVTVRVRTIWIAEPEDERPRFVTAYPS